MKTLIRLKIEKLIENNQEYFVATSNDLEGLLPKEKLLKKLLKSLKMLLKFY